MALQVVGRDGPAVLVADGDVGAVIEGGRVLTVALVGTIIAMGEFDEATEPLPAVPEGLAERMERVRRVSAA